MGGGVGERWRQAPPNSSNDYSHSKNAAPAPVPAAEILAPPVETLCAADRVPTGEGKGAALDEAVAVMLDFGEDGLVQEGGAGVVSVM